MTSIRLFLVVFGIITCNRQIGRKRGSVMVSAASFAPTIVSKRITSNNSNSDLKTSIQMVRRGAVAGGGKKKKNTQLQGKKKKKRNTKRNNNEKEGGRTRTSMSQNKTSNKKVTLPSNRSNAPPWQVGASAASKDDNAKESGGVKLSLLSDADRSLLSWKTFVPERDIGGVAFVGSYLSRRLPPRIGVPEVAFLGRSNVGKSSLLNCLTKLATSKDSGKTVHDQARVGKTPGATASVNLYALLEQRKSTSTSLKDMNKSNLEPPKPLLGFTDLPGFGYAKLSKENKESVEEAAERYLETRNELALGVLLVDARRKPSDDDRAVLAALYDLNVPLCIVATKVDKLGKNEVEPALETIQKELGLPPGQPLSISSITGEGISMIWKIIMESCESRIFELKENMEQFGEFKRPDDFDTIKLNNSGESIEDDEIQYDMGYDWIHADGGSVMYEDDGEMEDFDEEYHFDDNDSISYLNEDAKIKMRQNEERQAEMSEAMKLKSLNERVRRMERRGEI